MLLLFGIFFCGAGLSGDAAPPMGSASDLPGGGATGLSGDGEPRSAPPPDSGLSGAGARLGVPASGLSGAGARLGAQLDVIAVNPATHNKNPSHLKCVGMEASFIVSQCRPGSLEYIELLT